MLSKVNSLENLAKLEVAQARIFILAFPFVLLVSLVVSILLFPYSFTIQEMGAITIRESLGKIPKTHMQVVQIMTLTAVTP